jgi:hypothetical protein
MLLRICLLACLLACLFFQVSTAQTPLHHLLEKKLLQAQEDMLYYEQMSTQPTLETGWKRAHNNYLLYQNELKKLKNTQKNPAQGKEKAGEIPPAEYKPKPLRWGL